MSRSTFDTQEDAYKAAKAHEKRCPLRYFGQGVHVYRELAIFPKRVRVQLKRKAP